MQSYAAYTNTSGTANFEAITFAHFGKCT